MKNPIKNGVSATTSGHELLDEVRCAQFSRWLDAQLQELKTGKFMHLTRVTRPGCWINMIPAGGLLLIPEFSSGCTCSHAIQTSLALVPRER